MCAVPNTTTAQSQPQKSGQSLALTGAPSSACGSRQLPAHWGLGMGGWMSFGSCCVGRVKLAGGMGASPYIPQDQATLYTSQGKAPP